MRSRKREAIFMGVGILAGLALSGPAAQAATTINATLSSQPIYVDGQRVAMTAYSIGGNNYVKLRDIGKAVDFGVTYDAATNSVYIDPSSPYIEEIATPVQTQTSPSVITEETVRFAILALKETYPHGAVYPAPYCTKSLHRPYTNCDHCAGWAMLCSDAAFGSLPWRRVDNPRWEDSSYFDQRGMKWKGNNLYTVLPTQVAVDQFHQRQLDRLELDAERRRARKRQECFARDRPQVTPRP